VHEVPGTPPRDDGRRLPTEREPAAPLPRWLSLSLVALAAAVLIATTYLAVVHVDDRYRVDHVAGTRMALAQRVTEGTLYPELYDGELYGGSRFMPLPVVLHAALDGVIDDLLVSGKLLSYAAMLALLATTFGSLKRAGCPTSVSLGLSSLILTTDAGFTGAMDMRGDVLALALQLAAVAVAATSTRERWWLAAAPLAAVAFVVKLSALWAPIAIVLWLAFRRERRQLVAFVAAYAVVTVVLVALFAMLSEGRIFENVTGLATSGVGGVRDVILAPYRLFHLLVQEATTGWALIPLAVVGVWVSVREPDRGRSLRSLSLAASAAITLFVLTDVGTGRNQLIDPLVLAVVVVGGLAATDVPSGASSRGPRAVPIVVALTTAWLLLSGLAVTLLPDVEATIRGEATFPRQPLAGIVDAETSLLTEDPYVALSVGQTPVILDAFMLPRLEQARPGAVADLVQRIRAHEFDVIVLLEGVEPVDRTWWAELDLGIPVVRAIADSYEYDGITNGYFVYTPAGSP
jgi:hypothetical protein